MTLLDDIISASTDTAKSTPDLLRMVRIVARRVGAQEIEEWSKNEVGGYPDDAELPRYREIHTNVKGLFTGPMHSEIKYDLTIKPKGLEQLWRAELRQPLAELQGLAEAAGDSDPQIPWPAQAVEAYERLGGLRLEYHGLFEAHQVITRQNLRGIIDSIRSKALEFALDLQDMFPDAGQVDGPTIATQPALAQTIGNITYNITGHGTNIATGAGVQQHSRVEVGDVAGLRRAATEAGLPDAEAGELVAAVEIERDGSGPRTTSVLDRVRSGAITLSTTIGAEAAAGLLATAIAQYLGLG